MQDETSLRTLLTEMGSSQIKRVNGNNLQCTCPFAPWTHGGGKDSKPSFSVSFHDISKWNCFSCGRKGIGIRSLVRIFSMASGRDLSSWENFEQGQMGFKDYTLRLPRAPARWSNESWSTTQESEREFLWEDFEHLTREIHPYAYERKLTEQQVRKWRIGWDKYTNRLFIPVFDHNGKMVGFSGRAIPPFPDHVPKFKHAPGFVKALYFYGEEFFNPKLRTAILVEGFMDVWALDRMGYENVFAFMGTSVSDHQLIKLWKWVDSVIIIPDNDKPNPNTGECAGQKAANAWRSALLELGKKAIISPVIKGKKDVDEWNRREISFVLNKISESHKIELPLSELHHEPCRA